MQILMNCTERSIRYTLLRLVITSKIDGVANGNIMHNAFFVPKRMPSMCKVVKEKTSDREYVVINRSGRIAFFIEFK